MARGEYRSSFQMNVKPSYAGGVFLWKTRKNIRGKEGRKNERKQ
jgi:hypothetical protein